MPNVLTCFCYSGFFSLAWTLDDKKKSQQLLRGLCDDELVSGFLALLASCTLIYVQSL